MPSTHTRLGHVPALLQSMRFSPMGSGSLTADCPKIFPTQRVTRSVSSLEAAASTHRRLLRQHCALAEAPARTRAASGTQTSCERGSGVRRGEHLSRPPGSTLPGRSNIVATCSALRDKLSRDREA
eukprot:354988-Chlamydomonas_euryale.AAC.19